MWKLGLMALAIAMTMTDKPASLKADLGVPDAGRMREYARHGEQP